MIRILLADDNQDSRSALALLLETRLGAVIVGEASTMECLLEQAAITHPDVVLLDWELPGKPEADRIVVVRSVASNARVIVVSARPESASQAIGADAFVNKIDPPEHILAVLQERNEK
ncbi:MAG: response regulator transcription factor [Anaerolineales bacterium]|nr:response regulator transcription factor [Anaerolineales bacterium]